MQVDHNYSRHTLTLLVRLYGRLGLQDGRLAAE